MTKASLARSYGEHHKKQIDTLPAVSFELLDDFHFDVSEEVMEFVDVYKLYKIDTSEELALPEFYAKHKDNLPMFIIVSGGYYGQTKYDDMSTDQVCNR